MEEEDIEITCQDCRTPFVFTAQDQAFYAEKSFTPPKRCRSCRQARKENGGGGRGPSAGARGPGASGGGRPDRELFDAVCAECNEKTQVPFEPSGDRPVYCRDCFKARRR